MTLSSRQLMLATSLVLATAATGVQANPDTTSQNMTEVRQETQIWTTYALNPYLRANDIKVSVHDSKATLTGKVEESVNKDLAKQIALGVDGIKEVDNQLVVQSDFVAVPHGMKRSYGDRVDDATVTASVRSKLTWSKYEDDLSANVETTAGKVTLQGTADSAEAKKFAGDAAMNTHGVTGVDNQLRVSGTDAKTGKDAKYTAAAGHDVADGWITAKVKSTYMYSSNVSGSDISVSTDKGIVTLIGKLDSGAERALAIELAQNVRGVKSVQSKALTF